jgi:sterol desaturase/sphingolipid hydroxylase (fatty acid hydroxylase superfamily)
VLIVFTCFSLLSLATLADSRVRRRSLARSRAEWAVDAASLVSQGLLVPLLQTSLLVLGLRWAAPGLEASVSVPPAAAFLLNFVAVDYLYYWNHRLLHRGAAWRFHRLHHSATHLDVWVSSRNSAVTPLLIVYFWANGLALYLLAEPAGFALALALTAALDLWRHGSWFPAAGTLSHRALSRLLITPHEHAWHHSSSLHGVNFGANLALWDRLHGTYATPAEYPAELGLGSEGTVWKDFLAPRKDAA